MISRSSILSSYHLRRICYPFNGRPEILEKLRDDWEYSPNSDISLVARYKLGWEDREGALSRENVFFFPEVAKASTGTYSIQTEMEPSFLAVALEQLSDRDKTWLQAMTKESFSKP